MKKLNLDFIIYFLFLVILSILSFNLLKYRNSYINCQSTNNEFISTQSYPLVEDSLFYSYMNRLVPEEIVLKNYKGSVSISNINKESIFLFLSDLSCSSCIENKINQILSGPSELNIDRLIIVTHEPNPRDLSLFIANNGLYPENVYMINKENSIFPMEEARSFLFIVTPDNRIQNLKSFENIGVHEMHLYLSALIRSRN